MQIFNILEALVEPTETTKQYGGDLVKRSKNKAPVQFNKKKELGGGVHGTAKPDPNDEHMAIRYNHRPQDEENPYDGFRKLLRLMKENRLMDDPHFVKVYGITRIDGKNGKHIYKYKVEKLVKWTSLSDEEMESIINTHFNGDMDIGEDGENIIDSMCVAIENFLESGQNPDIFNGTFKRSMLNLKDAYQSHVPKSEFDILYLDIHSGNIMVRRGPHGLQLVFTDIFS